MGVEKIAAGNNGELLSTGAGARFQKNLMLFFIDNRIHFEYLIQLLGGRNSVVECHLAKVDVDGSNPFARSNFFLAA